MKDLKDFMVSVDTKAKDLISMVKRHKEYDYKNEVDFIYPILINEMIVCGGQIEIGVDNPNFSNIYDVRHSIISICHPYITESAQIANDLAVFNALIKRLRENGFNIRSTESNQIMVSI
ncbi:hypothetical protein 65p018 [Aeromonas phage 65]|uniref:Uncharacterized protein n=2 Tax=Ishigurovirus osborne TaxID=260149 RepID=A0A219YBP7_9CAUD|nr:hypothetical protein ST65p018 [Aeromonas phage 65]AAR90920.1 hypothetical protein 65p018 [Aeromonas phage 65]APU01409.1 hypothetical protein [Aeromonas phage 65.2]